MRILTILSLPLARLLARRSSRHVAARAATTLVLAALVAAAGATAGAAVAWNAGRSCCTTATGVATADSHRDNGRVGTQVSWDDGRAQAFAAGRYRAGDPVTLTVDADGRPSPTPGEQGLLVGLLITTLGLGTLALASWSGFTADAGTFDRLAPGRQARPA